MSALRTIAVLAVASTPLWGQFHSLATPSDGSAVYFTTTLRLKYTAEPVWGKVFAADGRGVRVVASRKSRIAVPPGPGGNCVLGQLVDFTGVELSADGKTLAARGGRWSAGECHGAGAATLLRGPWGSRDVNGSLRLSANGRWAVVDTTLCTLCTATATIWDLQTGARTNVDLPAIANLQFAAGRTVANDGTVVLSQLYRGYIVRPGGSPQPFPYNYPLAISANGARLLYLFDSAIHLVDLATQQDEKLSGSIQTVPSAGLSDDGSRAAFIEKQQLFVADFGGGGARQVASVSDGLTSMVLSGNGKVAYATTGFGRLIQIAVDTGVTTEIVGRTPSIDSIPGPIQAGSGVTVVGHGFSDQSYVAGIPVPLTLGGVSATLDGRPVPVAQVQPTQVGILTPWDMASAAPRTVTIRVNSANTPFDDPQGLLQVTSSPAAGPMFHENWSSLLGDRTARVGEIIHIYATGLGAVTPEVAPGEAAPSAEPLARLAAPMTCSNSEVLYAGLAPGTVQRQYFINLKIGPTTGYQQFTCTIGGGAPFAFVTLTVVQ